jgi:hypothetical protein
MCLLQHTAAAVARGGCAAAAASRPMGEAIPWPSSNCCDDMWVTGSRERSDPTARYGMHDWLAEADT